MAYTLRPGQPYADQGIRISNGQGAALLSSIQRELENKIRQRGFPAVVTMDEVKSGTGLFAQKLPMLVIRHPNPPFKYREVGVIVNGNTVTFPLWGPGRAEGSSNEPAQSRTDWRTAYPRAE